MLAPIRIGGGTKYKILESMAAGLPVITSPRGVTGMLCEDKKDLLLAQTAEDVLASITYLQDNSKRLTLVKSARVLVEKEYSWDFIAQKLDTVWRETA